MNKEEAIKRIKQNISAAEFHLGLTQLRSTIENELLDIEAFKMAIEALEAMDNAHNTAQHVECIGEKIGVPMLEDAIKCIAWYCAKHSCSECLLAKGDDDECIRFSIPCDWIDWFEEGDR